MKVSDYIIQFIADQKVKHVFLISGGAIIHTADSASRHPDIEYICTQHEQGSGAAADAYSRISENLGVTLVTSGPGATNLVTSVCNAYFDSIPVLFISGQVATFRIKPNPALRQKGFQETDVVSIFKSITKYSVQVKRAIDIKYELTKAVHLARSGRPGPVVLDIPDDIQREDINPDELSAYEPKSPIGYPYLVEDIRQLNEFIDEAQRPVLVLGAGILVSQTRQKALAFIKQLNIPVMLTWGAMDLLAYDDPLNMGGFGVCGPRGGNFAVQNSDLVIALGTRMSQQLTGGKQNLFAQGAKKVMVDIDQEEFKKFGPKELLLDLAIESDLHTFFDRFEKVGLRKPADQYESWIKQIQQWRNQFPICPKEYYDQTHPINVYVFMKELSKVCKEGDTIITDAGGNLSWTMQAFETKKNQRLFSAWNHSPMGYSLPASIGAALVSQKEVICIIGDGGIMMCLEELATIRKYNLPVKIFVINNHGHGIQKQTADTWLESRYTAMDEETGLYFPNFEKCGQVFDIPTFHLDNHTKLIETIDDILKTDGPILCDVEINPDQTINPMLRFGSGLEDLHPPLESEVITQIMSTNQSEVTK